MEEVNIILRSPLAGLSIELVGVYGGIVTTGITTTEQSIITH